MIADLIVTEANLASRSDQRDRLLIIAERVLALELRLAEIEMCGYVRDETAVPYIPGPERLRFGDDLDD